VHPLQALRLCTGCTAHRGSRGITILFLDHSTRRGEGSASRPGRSLPPGKTRYPLYWRLGGPQGRFGQVRKNLAPTGIRSPNRPARSQSLYRLRYPVHIWGGRGGLNWPEHDEVKSIWSCTSTPTFSRHDSLFRSGTILPETAISCLIKPSFEFVWPKLNSHHLKFPLI